MGFYNRNHYEPGFKKVCFQDLRSFDKVVSSVLSTQYPFNKMDIPDEIQNPVSLDRRAIGLGMLVAFLLKDILTLLRTASHLPRPFFEPCLLPLFWLPDFDQSVNSRKNSMDTGERTRSGTGSGEAE